MSGRCQSCDVVLDRHPGYIEIEQDDGLISIVEDPMCNKCRSLSLEQYTITKDHQYDHMYYTEVFDMLYSDGVTPAAKGAE